MDQLEEKRNYVRRFFKETGDSYDAIVKMGTFGIDGLWKRAILKTIDHPERVLDLACGTGILTLQIAQQFPKCQIVGVDITESYLKVARQKAEALSIRNVQFFQQWAEDFNSTEPFDFITSSYLAKYADLKRLIKNLTKILRPGGRMIFHDFTYPHNPILAAAWEFHFKMMQSILSRFYPEWRDVFFDLPELVRRTAWVDDLTRAMEENAVTGIEIKILTLQGATLVTGKKPETAGAV
jgi:demethylmenaquinone methyltransferase / 2-methoxy-6-polyprenyl-1,4-benzoquinol methylase